MEMTELIWKRDAPEPQASNSTSICLALDKPPLPACTTELPVCVSQLASCPCVSPTAPMPHAASAAVHVHALHALPCSVSPSASPTQEFANMQKLAFAACDCEFVDCEFVEPATPACELEFVPEFIVSLAAPAEGVGACADAEDSTTAHNISGSNSNDAEKEDDPVARVSVDGPVDVKSVGPCVLDRCASPLLGPLAPSAPPPAPSPLETSANPPAAHRLGRPTEDVGGGTPPVTADECVSDPFVDQPAKRANMTREEKNAQNLLNRAKKQNAKATRAQTSSSCSDRNGTPSLSFDLSAPIDPDETQALDDFERSLPALTVEETKERFRQLQTDLGKIRAKQFFACTARTCQDSSQ